MRTYLKDSNSKKIIFLMVLKTDHVTGATGKTLTVTVSKNGAAFGAGGGSVAELAGGAYAYTPSAGDVDTLGPILYRATETDCDDCFIEGLIVAFDPYDAVRMGQTALPNAAPGANGGLPTTNGTKLNQTADLTAGQEISADVTKIGGVAQSATDLKDFADSGYDPATHKVQGVVLTDTCTANTDMRGTNNALLASSYTAPPTAIQNRQEMDSNSTQFALLVKLQQADVKLDITTTPWTEKYYEAGTATLLLTKVLYDENGDGISSIDSYIGQRMSL